MIDQPGGYPLTVDACWSDGACFDCAAPFTAGSVIGLRPLEKSVQAILCEACVRKELDRRATWVRETLPGLEALAAAHATLMRDEETAMRTAGWMP